MEWKKFITLVKEHYKGSDRVWNDKNDKRMIRWYDKERK